MDARLIHRQRRLSAMLLAIREKTARTGAPINGGEPERPRSSCLAPERLCRGASALWNGRWRSERKCSDPTHPATAQSLSDLARVLRYQNDFSGGSSAS